MQVFDLGKWDWFIRNLLPVLQLPMTVIGTALGAGIGGWVAFKTTTKAHEAAAKREALARQDARRDASADRLRSSAERYVQLLWQMYGFQTDLATSLAYWAHGERAMTDVELARMQPPSAWSAELMMLEQLHLPFLQGEAFAYGDLMTEFGGHLGDLVEAVRTNGGDAPLAAQMAFKAAAWPLAQRMQRAILGLTVRLREAIHAAEQSQ